MEKIYNNASEKGGVYQIRNKNNGTPYIGSTSRFKKRARQHESSLRNHKHFSRKLQRAFDKYKEDAFIFEVLEVVEEIDEIIRRTIEQRYIDEVWPNCYNVKKKTIQKDGPWSSTPEETRRKLSETKKGTKNHFYGKHHSEETKKKQSEAHKRIGDKPPSWKDKHHSEETKRKMSEKHKNITDETRNKMSETAKGKNNPFYGKKHTKEARKKMSEAHKNKKRKPHTQETKNKISKALKNKGKKLK